MASKKEQARTVVAERAKAEAGGETCYGCGAEAGSEGHPIIAVVHSNDVDDESAIVMENPDATSDFVAVAVCKACHTDPAHRSSHAIKGHFFERTGNLPKMALMLAGSSDIGG